MSNVRVYSSFQIINAGAGNLNYKPGLTSFLGDMLGTKGPTPGVLSISTAGTDVDFSQLNTYGGLCEIANLDATNFLTWGIWNVANSLFFPVGEVLPGEQYVLRLSRFFGEDYQGVGTGTDASTANRLRLKANTATIVATVKAFDQ